jgi:hypothetical protein
MFLKIIMKSYKVYFILFYFILFILIKRFILKNKNEMISMNNPVNSDDSGYTLKDTIESFNSIHFS